MFNFKSKKINVFGKLNKLNRKQAYTIGAIVVVFVVALILLISAAMGGDDDSFAGMNARGYDLAQMPFATDEAENFLLANVYPDMKENGSSLIYSLQEKEQRQEEDAAAAGEDDEDDEEGDEEDSDQDYGGDGSYGSDSRDGGYGGYGYGGYGYGGYGGYGGYYNNYYSYMLMQQMYGNMNASSSTTIKTLDKDRYYRATLNGPAHPDRRPMMTVTYSLPKSGEN